MLTQKYKGKTLKSSFKYLLFVLSLTVALQTNAAQMTLQYKDEPYEINAMRQDNEVAVVITKSNEPLFTGILSNDGPVIELGDGSFLLVEALDESPLQNLNIIIRDKTGTILLESPLPLDELPVVTPTGETTDGGGAPSGGTAEAAETAPGVCIIL